MAVAICIFVFLIKPNFWVNNPISIRTDTMSHFEPPIYWNDHEDIAMKLYERFGDDFTESRIYRIRFTDLLEWILEIPRFEGTREQSTEGHLEMIQSAWVYEWRDNQK
jgi:FeS assembly protein IscX